MDVSQKNGAVQRANNRKGREAFEKTYGSGHEGSTTPKAVAVPAPDTDKPLCARAWINYNPKQYPAWRQVVQFYKDHAGTEWTGERLDRGFASRAAALAGLEEVLEVTGVPRFFVTIANKYEPGTTK